MTTQRSDQQGTLGGKKEGSPSKQEESKSGGESQLAPSMSLGNGYGRLGLEGVKKRIMSSRDIERRRGMPVLLKSIGRDV